MRTVHFAVFGWRRAGKSCLSLLIFPYLFCSAQPHCPFIIRHFLAMCLYYLWRMGASKVRNQLKKWCRQGRLSYLNIINDHQYHSNHSLSLLFYQYVTWGSFDPDFKVTLISALRVIFKKLHVAIFLCNCWIFYFWQPQAQRKKMTYEYSFVKLR